MYNNLLHKTRTLSSEQYLPQRAHRILARKWNNFLNFGYAYLRGVEVRVLSALCGKYCSLESVRVLCNKLLYILFLCYQYIHLVNVLPSLTSSSIIKITTEIPDLETPHENPPIVQEHSTLTNATHLTPAQNIDCTPTHAPHSIRQSVSPPDALRRKEPQVNDSQSNL